MLAVILGGGGSDKHWLRDAMILSRLIQVDYNIEKGVFAYLQELNITSLSFAGLRNYGM